MATCLRSIRDGIGIRRVILGTESDNTMAVTIIGLDDVLSASQPSLILSERLILDEARKCNMELLLRGNMAGLCWLASLLDDIAKRPGDGFSDFCDVDEYEYPDIVRSHGVMLRIRHPVPVWEDANFGTWGSVIRQRGGAFLPRAPEDPDEWVSEYELPPRRAEAHLSDSAADL